jgi:hypothetical protein
MDWYSRDHDVRLRFPHKTMFSSSLPPVVYVEWCPTHNMLWCFVFVFCLVCLRQVSCVLNVVSFSGLSIIPCPFYFFYRLEYESVFFLNILCK